MEAKKVLFIEWKIPAVDNGNSRSPGQVRRMRRIMGVQIDDSMKRLEKGIKMTPPYRKTLAIAEAFARYLESKDVSLIESFNREEIEIALLQLIKEDDAPYYTAMKIRREELKKKEETEKGATWKYRIKTIVIVIALAILLVFLKLIYYP